MVAFGLQNGEHRICVLPARRHQSSQLAARSIESVERQHASSPNQLPGYARQNRGESTVDSVGVGPRNLASPAQTADDPWTFSASPSASALCAAATLAASYTYYRVRVLAAD